MGDNKNILLIALMLMFVLFLSTIAVVFRLTGKLSVLEIAGLVILLIFAVIIVYGIINNRKKAWAWMLIFFSLNLANELWLLFKGVSLKVMILPSAATMIGFLVSITIKEDKEKELEVYDIEKDN
jgi:hypothetical protein